MKVLVSIFALSLVVAFIAPAFAGTPNTKSWGLIVGQKSAHHQGENHHTQVKTTTPR
jgi:hypothetical protein